MSIHPLIQYSSYRGSKKEEEEEDTRKKFDKYSATEEKIQEVFEMEYGEINDNSKITLIHFFEEFMEVYDELRAEDYSLLELESEHEELSKKLQLEKQIYDEVKNKLGNKLVTVQGLNLNPEMLQNNESPSFFRKKYDSLNQNGKEAILMREIEKLEEKIKYSPFWVDKNKSLLYEKKEELKRIKKAKAQAEAFESLTPEDKKEIIEYLSLKEKINNLEKQLYNNARERAKYRFPESEKCIKTWNTMLNRGMISDENLDELFKKLDKVGLTATREKTGFSIGVPHQPCYYVLEDVEFEQFLKLVQIVYQNAKEEIDSSMKKMTSSQGQTEVKAKKDEIGILEIDIEEVSDMVVKPESDKNDTLERSKSTNNEIDSFRAQMEGYVELVTEQKLKLYDKAEQLGVDFEKELDVARDKIALRNDIRAYYNGKKDITIKEINARCTELGLDFYNEMDKARDAKLPIATDIKGKSQKIADKQLSRFVQAGEKEAEKEYREYENPDINKNIEIKG